VVSSNGSGRRWRWICCAAALGATLATAPALANPPFPDATYQGTTSEGLDIVLVVDAPGTGLAAGSYIEFVCGTVLTRTKLTGNEHGLSGTSIHSASGVMQNSQTETPPETGATLTSRFFGRFLGSGGGGPGGTPPTGPPTGGQGGPPAQPPGDQATGDFSFRHFTGQQGGEGFCSGRLTWNVVKTAASATPTDSSSGSPVAADPGASSQAPPPSTAPSEASQTASSTAPGGPRSSSPGRSARCSQARRGIARVRRAIRRTRRRLARTRSGRAKRGYARQLRGLRRSLAELKQQARENC
jgi:hypothetical protein